MRPLQDSIEYVVMERHTWGPVDQFSKWRAYSEDEEHDAHVLCGKLNRGKASNEFVVVRRTVSEHLMLPKVRSEAPVNGEG